jgi:hypothetical protein
MKIPVIIVTDIVAVGTCLLLLVLVLWLWWDAARMLEETARFSMQHQGQCMWVFKMNTTTLMTNFT